MSSRKVEYGKTRAEAQVVERIMREYDAGYSQGMIARGLTKDLIPTARGTSPRGRRSASVTPLDAASR